MVLSGLFVRVEMVTFGDTNGSGVLLGVPDGAGVELGAPNCGAFAMGVPGCPPVSDGYRGGGGRGGIAVRGAAGLREPTSEDNSLADGR